MTESPKKPKAKRTAAKAKPATPKKASAPSRSKKSSPSKTETDGATQVAILVQEVNALKKEVALLHSELDTIRQTLPRSVFEVLQKMSSAYLSASEPDLVIKEIGVDGEVENEETQTIYVHGGNFIAGIKKEDGNVAVCFDSTRSDISPKRIAVFKDFLTKAGVTEGEIKANIYEVH